MGPRGQRGPEGPQGPARGSKSNLVKIVMKDMGLERIQAATLERKRSLEALANQVQNIKDSRAEIFGSMRNLQNDIQTHLARITTEGKTVLISI